MKVVCSQSHVAVRGSERGKTHVPPFAHVRLAHVVPGPPSAAGTQHTCYYLFRCLLSDLPVFHPLSLHLSTVWKWNFAVCFLKRTKWNFHTVYYHYLLHNLRFYECTINFEIDVYTAPENHFYEDQIWWYNKVKAINCKLATLFNTVVDTAPLNQNTLKAPKQDLEKKHRNSQFYRTESNQIQCCFFSCLSFMIYLLFTCWNVNYQIQYKCKDFFASRCN